MLSSRDRDNDVTTALASASLVDSDLGDEVEVAPEQTVLGASAHTHLDGQDPPLPFEWQLLPQDLTKKNEALEFNRMLIQDAVESDFGALGGEELWNLVDQESTHIPSDEEENDVGSPSSEDEKAQSEPEGVAKSTWMEEGEMFVGICRVDTRKGPPVTCSACANINGESIMIILQSCGCTICSICIIYSAIHYRQVQRVGSETTVSVPCPAWKYDDNDNDGEIVSRPCTGLIIPKELEVTLSAELLEEIAELGKRPRKRPQKKIYECTTNGCLGFCKVASRRTFFLCPLCNKWSKCLKCGGDHSKSSGCATIETHDAAAAKENARKVSKRKSNKMTGRSNRKR